MQASLDLSLVSLVWLLWTITSVASNSTSASTVVDEVQPTAVGSNEEKQRQEQQQNERKNEEPTSGGGSDDMWSMVASMGADNGPGRSEYEAPLWSMAREREQGSRGGDQAESGERSSFGIGRGRRRFKDSGGKFDWNIELDDGGKYRLSWRASEQLNKITFSLCLNTQHFKLGADVFALGFSERGESTKSSDFCLVWYDLSHGLHLQDAFTDTNNRLQLVNGRESVCKLLHSGEHSLQPSASSPNNGGASEKLDEQDLGDYEAGEESLEGRLEQDSGKAHGSSNSSSSSSDSGKVLEIVFKRPLEICHTSAKYYTIDRGTTHLIWFKLGGPVLELDGLDLGAALESKLPQASGHSHGEKQHARNESQSGSDNPSSSSSYSSSSAAAAAAESSLLWAPLGEFGLKRVQLIAVKAAQFVSPASGGDGIGSAGGVARFGSATGHHNHYSGSSEQRDRSLAIRMDKFAVPGRETTYWCKLFKLPRRFEARRYHITSYAASIEPRPSEQVVHHMELFNCANLSPAQADELEQLWKARWADDCGSAKRPAATQACKRVILAWAMGAKPLVYPSQVGQSIGGPDYSAYVVLEVHYNNVNKQTGLLDSSGLQFHYSAQLRPFDAGVLEVGLEYTDKNSIPPRMVAALAGHCVGECTRTAFTASNNENRNNNNNYQVAKKRPINQQQQQQQQRLEEAKDAMGDGIYVFAAQLHTHLTGVASWTEQVRAGELLGELQRDNHYSPHFQEIRLLPEPVYVAPGDSLIHYCLYDTRQRANITLGGFATSDEMCVTYLHYYPRKDLEVCKSSVDSRALEAYFEGLAQDEGQQTGGQAAGGVAEKYRSIEWSARRSRELLDFYARAPLSVQCNRSNGDRWPGAWGGHQQPQIFWPGPAGAGAKQVSEEGDASGAEWWHPARADFLGASSSARASGGAAAAAAAAQYRGWGAPEQRRRAHQCGAGAHTTTTTTPATRQSKRAHQIGHRHSGSGSEPDSSNLI